MQGVVFFLTNTYLSRIHKCNFFYKNHNILISSFNNPTSYLLQQLGHLFVGLVQLQLHRICEVFESQKLIGQTLHQTAGNGHSFRIGINQTVQLLSSDTVSTVCAARLQDLEELSLKFNRTEHRTGSYWRCLILLFFANMLQLAGETANGDISDNTNF